MISYQGPALELYKEALRTVPALMATRLRGAQNDAGLVISGYMREATELGVDRAGAWAVLFSASQITIASLVEALAHAEGADQAAVVERMIAAAQESVGSGAL